MNICTYFNSNYSNRGWALYKSLCNFLSDFNFYILCLDDNVYNECLNMSNVIPIKLNQIEDYEKRLISAKNNRQLKEYFATMSPILPLYIFDNFDVDLLFYSDADIAFWSDPNQMIIAIGDKSLMVIDHGFEPPRANVRFNVGILGYRNDEKCRNFLNWWTDRCLEWCKWETLPDGKMADQGYLNRLHNDSDQFNALCLDPIKSGINVGPWCADKCEITIVNGIPKINGNNNLICYHFHEFKLTNNGYYPTGWKLANGLIKYIYEPYYKLVKNA